jgi:RNA polymerase sigma-70 factor (ECF subfamily)
MLRPCKSRVFGRGTIEISGWPGVGQAKIAALPQSPETVACAGVCYHSRTPKRGATLATSKEMSDFLASVERRAFKQAVFSVHEEQAALDIVQDAMMRLAEKYADRPGGELPLLFQRILQNAIRDHFRRQKVRSTWTILLSNLGFGGDDEDADPLETLQVEEFTNVPASPADRLEQSQVMAAIEEAVQALPGRQREAFMLRYWEELDVSETAKVMGCSEGSVKTHCSRATHALAKVLRSKGITL